VEGEINNDEDDKNEQIWELMGQYQGRDKESIQKSIVNHVEYTLAMTRFDFNNFGCAQAAAYSLRDRTIESWNDTNLFMKHNNARYIYIFSMEYVIERLLKFQLINNDLEDSYREALQDIGYDLDEIYEEEVQFNLGSGLCGRIVGEYLDSLATMNIPCWAYGLRYEYGMFNHSINTEGEIVEIPQYWLEKGNPWELERADIKYKIQMGGESVIDPREKKFIWKNDETMQAVGYDIPITGFNTFNTNNLRLWRSRPYFDEGDDEQDETISGATDQAYVAVDLEKKIDKIQDAEYLTSIFFPNSPGQAHKEERLRQEFFYASATLQDMMRRFKKDVMFTMQEFHEKNQILLNEMHSAVSILEMLRILVDEEGLVWQTAWNTTHWTFTCAIYVNSHHNLEKWPIDIFVKVLPRHYQLIQTIDKLLIQQVSKSFHDSCTPEELRRKIELMTIIDTKTNMVRLANLCFVSCNKIIFCSDL
jgi:starch phosphorylase